jgi:hypothetical protein
MTSSPGNFNRYKREKNRSTGHPKKNVTIFFCLLRKKSFPKCPRTCNLVKNVKSYEGFLYIFWCKTPFFKELNMQNVEQKSEKWQIFFWSESETLHFFPFRFERIHVKYFQSTVNRVDWAPSTNKILISPA